MDDMARIGGMPPPPVWPLKDVRALVAANENPAELIEPKDPNYDPIDNSGGGKCRDSNQGVLDCKVSANAKHQSLAGYVAYLRKQSKQKHPGGRVPATGNAKVKSPALD